jgi:hypothetical protein
MNAVLTIQPPHVEGSGPYRISARLQFPDAEEVLWFETPLCPVEAADSFLLVMLPRAMREGLDIVVEGELSSQLYYNITQYYLAFLRTLDASLKPISIVAKRLTTKVHGGKGVFTGFSAGVDSFATILTHAQGVSEEYRVTHLLFNNVGSHGQSKNDQSVFEERLARLRTRAMGLPLLPVSSNLDQVMRSKFERTHTIRNCATALLFQNACAKFLYSSAVHYRDAFIGETEYMGYADAVGVALLSTETTQCISAGGQYTRFEKTALIAQEPATFEALDVCVQPKPGVLNCSSCWKCLRTELTLEMVDALDNYRNAFNMQEYRKVRSLFIAIVLKKSSLLNQEIAEQIEARDFKVPFASRILRYAPERLLNTATELRRHPKLWAKRIYWEHIKRQAARQAARESGS